MLDTPFRIIRGRVTIPRTVATDKRFGRIESACVTTARASLDRRY